jgi:hypothetical protein
LDQSPIYKRSAFTYTPNSTAAFLSGGRLQELDTVSFTVALRIGSAKGVGKMEGIIARLLAAATLLITVAALAGCIYPAPYYYYRPYYYSSYPYYYPYPYPYPYYR